MDYELHTWWTVCSRPLGGWSGILLPRLRSGGVWKRARVRGVQMFGVLCKVVLFTLALFCGLAPFLFGIRAQSNLFVRLLLLLLVRVNVSVHVLAVEEFLHLRNLPVRIEPHQIHEIVMQIFA